MEIILEIAHSDLEAADIQSPKHSKHWSPTRPGKNPDGLHIRQHQRKEFGDCLVLSGESSQDPMCYTCLNSIYGRSVRLFS